MQAAANAKENLNLSKLNLYVSECYADGRAQPEALHKWIQGQVCPRGPLRIRKIGLALQGF